MIHHELRTSLYLLAMLGTGCGGADHTASESARDRNRAGEASSWNGRGHSWGRGAAPQDPANEDADRDGIATDKDLCPDTLVGEAVDGNGCSNRRRMPGSGSPQSGSIGNHRPEDDGAVGENGFATFVLDATGRYPLVLRTLAVNVTKRATGFDLTGTVLLDVPGDSAIPLREARISLDRGRGGGLERIRGTVIAPFPDTGFMEGVSVAAPAVTEIGYDYGRTLADAAAPLDDERKYLFFTASRGFSAEIGDFSISCFGAIGGTIALDPTDKTIFARASFGGLIPVDEAGFALSPGGHLTFTPENTWGIDAEAAAFDGHLWINGKVNLTTLAGLPLVVGGNVVFDVDPNDDRRTVFVDPLGGVQFGSNAELALSIDGGFLGLEIPIAHATLVGRATRDGARAYYSGVIEAGTGFLPEAVPLKNAAALKIAGHASTDFGESYVQAEGTLAVDASTLGRWTGLDLESVNVARAALRIDRDGVELQGTANGRLSPVLGFSSDVELEAFFNGNPDDWYISFDGELVVRGVNLSSSAHARLDRSGIAVNGSFRTKRSAVSMSGSITRAGVDIRGKRQVTIPVGPAGVLGVFEGTADFRVGMAGLEGSLSGRYCTAHGQCAKPTGARVRFSNGGAQACVTVPVKGEVCAEI